MELKPGYKQTEVGVIPEEWEVRSLPDLCWFQEGPGVRAHQFKSSGVKLLNGTNISNGRVNLDTTTRYVSNAEARGIYRHFLVDDGDILLATSGVTIDTLDEKVAFARADALPLCMNTSTVRFKVAVGELLDDYLYFVLQSNIFKNQIGRQATGSAQLNFGPAHLKKVAIPLSADLGEQHAIAEALADVDSLVARLDELIAKKRALKQGALQELVMGRRRLPGFSGEWENVRIADVAEVKTGPFGSVLHESDYVQDGTPIITVEHLGEFGVIHSNLPLVSDSDCQRLRAYLLDTGDLVFSRVGSVDRNALIRRAETGWLFSGRLLRVRPERKRVFAPYLSFQFHSEDFKRRVREVAVGQTMASLNTQILKNLAISLPSWPEQAAIADVLVDMDAEIEALEARREKTRALKQGMMQELLTGKTRLVSLFDTQSLE